MPIYEYQCRKCKHRFEKIQKFSEKPLKKCPECGGNLEQLISAPAVQFKGSGWYVTDYKNKGGSSQGKSSDPSSESAAGSSGESSRDGGESSASADKGDKSEKSDKAKKEKKETKK